MEWYLYVDLLNLACEKIVRSLLDDISVQLGPSVDNVFKRKIQFSKWSGILYPDLPNLAFSNVLMTGQNHSALINISVLPTFKRTDICLSMIYCSTNFWNDIFIIIK